MGRKADRLSRAAARLRRARASAAALDLVAELAEGLAEVQEDADRARALLRKCARSVLAARRVDPVVTEDGIRALAAREPGPWANSHAHAIRDLARRLDALDEADVEALERLAGEGR